MSFDGVSRLLCDRQFPVVITVAAIKQTVSRGRLDDRFKSNEADLTALDAERSIRHGRYSFRSLG